MSLPSQKWWNCVVAVLGDFDLDDSASPIPMVRNRVFRKAAQSTLKNKKRDNPKITKYRKTALKCRPGRMTHGLHITIYTPKSLSLFKLCCCRADELTSPMEFSRRITAIIHTVRGPYLTRGHPSKSGLTTILIHPVRWFRWISSHSSGFF